MEFRGAIMREAFATPVSVPVTGRLASRPLVMPFARALAVLAAFTPKDRWLANRELADRTRLPASTVRRLAQSLLHLGYLQRDAEGHKYRLSAAVLALGYAAIANSGLRNAARRHMQAFSEAHGMDVALWSRDRLELTVVESCAGGPARPPVDLHVGVRAGIACSPVGWTLLGVLPELERYYLMDRIEQREDREWPRQRRRLCEALSQVKQLGYCVSIDEWPAERCVVAVPILIEGGAPLVLSCAGHGAHITRARVQRELAPRLMAAAEAIANSSLLLS
jgi:DNA-binding IclR family transcriptional regulator